MFSLSSYARTHTLRLTPGLLHTHTCTPTLRLTPRLLHTHTQHSCYVSHCWDQIPDKSNLGSQEFILEQSFMTRHRGGQKRGGHPIPRSGRKLRKMANGSQFTSSFLFSLGPQTLCPHTRGGSHLLRFLSGSTLIDTSRF